MQSSQVRNVGLPSSAETKRDVPAWTQDPKIFPLDWFSVSRPNIIRQTKEYVSELSKWRNCPKIKTVSKLKAVLKRIMMFLHTHTSYIDGKSLLECDLEEDLITLVSLYMDMELRVLLIKKSTASGATSSGQGLCNNPGPGPEADMDTARNDKLVADRISYWLYTVLTGHEQRVDALLSITVFSRHTRPVLDPIFRKILTEMSDGPFSSVNYVRHMLAYKTWRERALLADDMASEELNTRVLQQLFPRESAFPPQLLRCLGKGDSARDHARPHNVNLSDACRNFMRFCREMPATVADQINFESIPLFDDDMLSDEENEVNKLMNMISDRKQRKSASLSPRSSSFQVDAFIDLTLPKLRMKSNSSRGVLSATVPDIIDLTKDDEKPIMSSRTSAALEPPFATLSRTAYAVQRISASKKVQPPQDCSYAMAPSAAQVETHCFTAFREQDIYLGYISCMCPVRAHRQRECQCQDKKVRHFKKNKALKTKAERKCENDATFVGPCFQFSIGGNQYAYPNEDDVDTEIQPIVVGNSQDQVKMEMKTTATVTCSSDENEIRDESSEFCDNLFSASLNLCDCDECKRRDSNLSRYENRTCTSAETRGESENEHSDNNVQFRQKPLVTCTQQMSHPASVADMYAMKKTSPILLLSQPSTSLSQNENEFEHFSETNKRKFHLSENITQNNETSQDNFNREGNLSYNSKDKMRINKLPVNETDIRLNNAVPSVLSESVFINTTNLIAPTKKIDEISEYKNTVSPQKNNAKFTESTNNAATSNETVESEIVSVFAASTNAAIATTIHEKNTLEIPTTDKISLKNVQNENSDTVAEIEKLCTKLSETGFSNTQSIVPELNNVVEKDEVSASKELLPNELAKVTSSYTTTANGAETNVSTYLIKPQPTCNVPILDTTAANVAETNVRTHPVEKQPTCNVPVLDATAANVTETNVIRHLAEIQPTSNVHTLDTSAANVAETNVRTHLGEIQPTCNVPILDTIASNVAETNVSTQLVEIQPTCNVPIIDTTAVNVAETNVSTHLVEIQPTCNVPIIDTTAVNVTETNVSTHLVEIQPTCNVPILDTTAANVAETNVRTHLGEIQPTCNVPIINTTAANVAETNIRTHLGEIQPTCNVPIIDTTAVNVAETNVRTHPVEIQPTCNVPILDATAANVTETNVIRHLAEIQPTCNVPILDATAANVTETNVIRHLAEIQPTSNVHTLDTSAANVAETNVRTHPVEIQPTCNVPVLDATTPNVAETNVRTHLVEIQPTCNVPILDTTAADVAETNVRTHLDEIQSTCNVSILDITATNVTETNVSAHLVEIQPTCNVPILDTTAVNVAETKVRTHLVEIQPTCNVPILDTTAANIAETNVRTHLVEIQPTCNVPILDTTATNVTETNVSMHLIDTSNEETNVYMHLIDVTAKDEKNGEGNDQPYMVESIQIDVSQVRLEENLITNTEEKIDPNTMDTVDDQVTNEVNLTHSENSVLEQTCIEFVDELAPEQEIVINTEVVVESISKAADTCHVLNISNENQLEHDSISAELSPFDSETVKKEDLQAVSIKTDVQDNISDPLSNSNNMRKRRMSSVVNTNLEEISVDSKNCFDNISHLSPRKRQRRKPKVKTDDKTSENKYDQHNVDTLHAGNCPEINNIYDNPEKPSRRKSWPSDEVAPGSEIFRESKLIINESEPIYEKTISGVFEDKSLKMNHTNLASKISIDEKKPDSKGMCEQESVKENISTNQNSKEEKPKRRRKQNLKSIIKDDKLTSPIHTLKEMVKEDQSTSSTQKKDKKLCIVCKKLTQTEIDHFKKIKCSSEIHKNIISVEENQNKLMKSRQNEDTSGLVSNNLIEDSTTKLTEKGEQMKLNLEKNGTAIENSSEIEFNKNLKVTSLFDSTEMEIQAKIKVKSKRKNQLDGSNVDKIKNKATEDQLVDTTRETMKRTPVSKLKRSRGRPPKIVSNKLKFFAENFNLQNLDSKTTKSDINEDIKVNSLEKMNTSSKYELSEEDIPLAYRMSQSVSQNKNSFKLFKLNLLTNVENKLVNPEENLPLTTRKHKLKAPQSSMKTIDCTVITKLTSEPITKPKSLRNKLEKFKFQPRNKSETKSFTTQKEEAETLSLKKSNKCLKTYSNTKALRALELSSMPNLIQPVNSKKSKSVKTAEDQQSISTEINSEEIKNEEIFFPRSVQIKELRDDSTKIVSVRNDVIELSTINDKNIANTVQKIEETENKVETKTDDLVTERISKSKDLCITNENTDISPQPPVEKSECTEEVTDNGQINMKTEVDEHKDILIGLNQLPTNLTSDCRSLLNKNSEVNIKTYTKPVNINSHLTFVPKLLSKKAKEKLFALEMKTNSNETLDVVKETDKKNKETPESKNILNHDKTVEGVIPDNNELYKYSKLSCNDSTDCINNAILPESSSLLYHKNKNSSKLITSNEPEIITNKDDEVTIALSETCEKAANSDEISTIPSEELCIKLQDISRNAVDKNVGPVELPINNNYEQQNSEIILKSKSDDSLHSVHRPLKMRKSKFRKLKFKLNSKTNLMLSRKLRNVKSLPKGKSRFNQRKKNSIQLAESNDHIKETLLSVMRKTKKTSVKKSSKAKKPWKKIDLNLKDNASHCLKYVPTANSKLNAVKNSTKTSEQDVQICVNISNDNSILNPNNTTKSIEFTNASDKMPDDDKLDLKISPVNINNQNITEDIENIESAKIDNKTDMLYKPNKIYEKHFDFYSDQDDVSNSELVIDTSAESSEAEESATCDKIKANKINHQIQIEVAVSKQSKYHHSIAEIVNLNKESIPVEDKRTVNDNDFTNSSENKILNNVNEDCQGNTLSTSDVQTVINRESTTKHQEDSVIGILSLDQVSYENRFSSAEHQRGDMFDKVSDSSLLSTISEMVNVTEEIQHSNKMPDDLKEEIVSVKDTKVQNFVEDVKEVNIRVENKNIILKEHTAVTTEISEEISDELNTATNTEEKIQHLVQPFGPSVEMFVNIEVGLESCTISQKKPLVGEHAKEGCVKCSVNGKHKDNKRVTIRGMHHYQRIHVEECLEENEIIPAIPFCQAVESFEPNLCTLISKIESVKILTNNSPVPDNYNLLFLADIAMNSVHLNNENTVIEITAESSNVIHNQRPLQKDERCVLVSIPEKLPASNKSAINLSIINSNHEEVSVNIQKLAGGVNAKGIILENKIQALAERVRNGLRPNGENLNELYESLENICEIEINTLTRTSPKPDGPGQHNILPVPNDIPQVNSKIPEPNITIDIPNTALLHLTPDDDDFMIRNEPFSLQPQPTALQSLPSDAAPESTATENEAILDSTGVKNLCKVLDSLTNNKKEINSKNENLYCKTVKEAEKETKTKNKKERSKLKSSNNQSSETSYWLNKYKNNHDCNKQIEINNQQNISNNKNTSTSPQSYIRSTRPMRMVTTKKRNINVLDNNCPSDEPAKKVSASEKMFDKLLEEHKKEISEAKLKDETTEEIFVDASAESRRDETKKEISSSVNVCLIKDATMPILEDSTPETNKLSTDTTPAEGLNIPLSVLQYKMSESDKNDKLISPTDPIKLVKPSVTVEEEQNDISVNQSDIARKEDKRMEKISEETTQDTLSEDSLVNTKIYEQIEITEKYSLNQEETINETILTNSTQTQGDKNMEEQIIEDQTINTVHRNTSAVEVVQNWFNRVDANKTDSYTEIASDHTIEECSFFEEISSTSENSPNARKSDEKVFTEHQTPDSGIAFDEDSVQKDKSVDSQTPVPENLSDSETMNSKSYFHNLGKSTSGSIRQKVKITDIKMSKSDRPREINNKILKVSIALERIKDIVPLLTKHKMVSPERKMKKRKECSTDSEKGKKRKHNAEEIYLSPVTEHDSSKTLLKDCIIKRRKYSEDDNIVEESLVEEIVSNQNNVSSTVRTKGSVKEYPDCLFGITESPVPSGSFNSPYPSDISLTEEPTFYEEGGMVLFNDYPCYDSFEVLQEQQSLQREYNVVDDNPKDVQQGLQAQYCVVDSQFLPISEYMNDGEYILIDNNIFNDKRMVPVNMHEVQPEAKPHNTEELKRSEFDDSEKEDNLSETVDEIIKNPNLFTEQSTSEVQVISMDQATSEVQVVIACDTYQETEMSDTYLFGIALPNEATSCDSTSTAAISEIQHTPLILEEATSASKVTNKPIDCNPKTPVVSPENTQFCNTRVIPVVHVTEPVSKEPSMEAVDSISEPTINQDVLNNKELPEQKSRYKKLTNTSNNVEVKLKTTTVNPDEKKKEEKNNKLYNRRLSSPESSHLIVSASKTPSYSSSVKNDSKIQIPASSSAIHPSTPVQNSSSKLPKPCVSKSSKKLSDEQFNEVFENKNMKELETKVCSSKMVDRNNSASNITSLSYKDMKRYDCHQGSKIPNKKNHYNQKSQISVQKSLVKTYEPTSPSPNKKQADPKIYPKPNCPNTYISKVPKDAFDKLKEERTDITPPDNRNRYNSSSSSDSNFIKNHNRKVTQSTDYNRKYSSDRDSSSSRHSDSRRPHSAYTEPSPEPAYQLPSSDPTHRSSQYKKTNMRTSQPRNIPEQNQESPSSSYSHDDWLKNETLLNLIKSASCKRYIQ